MKMYNYFLSLSEEINRLNSIINETKKFRDKYNPFIKNIPYTIVWIEKDKE